MGMAATQAAYDFEGRVPRIAAAGASAPARIPNPPHVGARSLTGMPVQYEKVQGGRDARAGDLQASILKAIKVAVFMAVIIAIAGIARVWLTTSAVDTQRQSNMIKTQISEQRAAGVALEVKYNSMTDPTVIEKAADSRLGMEPPKEATFIDLG